MTTLLLTLALFCGQFDDELAIAIAINAPQPAQQSVVTEPKVQPPVNPVQQFTTRQETRTKRVWGKVSCTRRGCRYGWIDQEYTVTVKVPVADASWPHYPTTNKRIFRLDGGRGAHADWRHLTQGDHAGKFNAAWLQTLSQAEIESLHADDHTNQIKWAYVVRP